MDWKWHESSAESIPAVDETSSKVFVYVRKNIERITKENEDGTTVELWKYQEKKVLKSDWDVYKDVLTNSEGIAENGSGLIDIAELADENSNGIVDLAEYIGELEARIEELEGR